MSVKNIKQPESKIPLLSPAPLRRTGSLRLGACPPIQENCSSVNSRPKLNRHRSLQSLNTASSFNCEQDEDNESVRSFSSTTSAYSNLSQCDHADFARNGTTYSGRSKRYVVHCSTHSNETDDYLTPTQRTNRTIRKLRALLKDAQEELIEKDKEILRLTKEVVELRLLKAENGNESNDIDGDIRLDKPREDFLHSNNRSSRCDFLTSSPVARCCSSPPLAQSLSDSGHFEDLHSSKDPSYTSQSTINHTKALEALQRQHEDEIRELKERHNDKVDSLLQRITDVNDRYYSLRSLYEDCKEKLKELEKANEQLTCSTCQVRATTIADLESSNEKMLQDKQLLSLEIDELKRINAESESSKTNHDTLELENVQLKSKLNDLMKSLDDLKKGQSTTRTIPACDLSEATSQTEHIPNVCFDSMEVTQNGLDNNEEHLNCLKQENCELKSKIEQLKEQAKSEKDIYMQLYTKGIQAAKLLDKKEIENQEFNEKESSLIPDLLQKLKVKQDELDNMKAMYRRLLDSRREQPKHDPEMTLQFLKSAFYYFLTDRENATGHLSAIESILGFTDNEKINIDKAFMWR